MTQFAAPITQEPPPPPPARAACLPALTPLPRAQHEAMQLAVLDYSPMPRPCATPQRRSSSGGAPPAPNLTPRAAHACALNANPFHSPTCAVHLHGGHPLLSVLLSRTPPALKRTAALALSAALAGVNPFSSPDLELARRGPAQQASPSASPLPQRPRRGFSGARQQLTFGEDAAAAGAAADVVVDDDGEAEGDACDCHAEALSFLDAFLRCDGSSEDDAALLLDSSARATVAQPPCGGAGRGAAAPRTAVQHRAKTARVAACRSGGRVGHAAGANEAVAAPALGAERFQVRAPALGGAATGRCVGRAERSPLLDVGANPTLQAFFSWQVRLLRVA